MHGYDIHEIVYLDCEIHGTLLEDSDPRAGPVWPHNENVSKIIKCNTHDAGVGAFIWNRGYKYGRKQVI